MNAALRALILASVFKERSGGAPDSARKFKLRALSELHAAGNDDGDAEVEIKQTSAAGSIRRWARGRRTLSPVGASQRRAGEGQCVCTPSRRGYVRYAAPRLAVPGRRLLEHARRA